MAGAREAALLAALPGKRRGPGGLTALYASARSRVGAISRIYKSEKDRCDGFRPRSGFPLSPSARALSIDKVTERHRARNIASGPMDIAKTPADQEERRRRATADLGASTDPPSVSQRSISILPLSRRRHYHRRIAVSMSSLCRLTYPPWENSRLRAKIYKRDSSLFY